MSRIDAPSASAPFFETMRVSPIFEAGSTTNPPVSSSRSAESAGSTRRSCRQPSVVASSAAVAPARGLRISGDERAFGFRNPPGRAAEEIDVVVLGDSFGVGVGTPRAATWVAERGGSRTAIAGRVAAAVPRPAHGAMFDDPPPAPHGDRVLRSPRFAEPRRFHSSESRAWKSRRGGR